MRKYISIFIKKMLYKLRHGSMQKKLGFPAGTKLLVIHADDIGLSSSENRASFDSISFGMVNSGSVMVPCEKTDEVAEYLRKNPQTDLGIHLTITSEWDTYKWKPVLNRDEVNSLVDEQGYFFSSKKQMFQNADPEDVEKEYRAQVEKALESGIHPTHLDSHMYSAFSGTEITKRYIDIGNDYKLPVLLTYDLPLGVLNYSGMVVVDELYCADYEDYKAGLEEYYKRVIKSIRPGLNCILVHVAYDNEEMKSIMRDNPNFGAKWRQADFDFFTSDACHTLIDENNIRLITWKEIKDRIYN